MALSGLAGRVRSTEMDEDIKDDAYTTKVRFEDMTAVQRWALSYGDWLAAKNHTDHMEDAITYAAGSVTGSGGSVTSHLPDIGAVKQSEFFYQATAPVTATPIYIAGKTVFPHQAVAVDDVPDPEPLQGDILDRLAGSLVGDGKDPDLFFVCTDGICQMVCVDVEVAYDNYIRYVNKYDPSNPFSNDSCNSISLESRSWGVICSVEQVAGVVNTLDESVSFRNQVDLLRSTKKIK